jgi:uncharacterized protein (DUF2147 family)
LLKRKFVYTYPTFFDNHVRIFMRNAFRTFAALLFLSSVSVASAASPIGLWKTVDDETGEERSFIRIKSVGQSIEGSVEEIIVLPGDDPAQLCTACEGSLKDQPVIGMRIMWGFEGEGSTWKEGYIMDPNNGKTYRCKLAVEDDNQSMRVRGYSGVSLLGRTQTWYRVE